MYFPVQAWPALSILIQELLTGPELAHSDVFRQVLQAGLQDLIDAEDTATIGADRYERNDGRTTRRNGTRPKRLATPAGELDLAIPKRRSGSFYPALLHPRRRVDKALWSVICAAWIDGVSNRKVEDLVRALGNDTGISKSQAGSSRPPNRIFTTQRSLTVRTVFASDPVPKRLSPDRYGAPVSLR